MNKLPVRFIILLFIQVPLLVWTLTSLLLLFSTKLYKLLKEKGLTALERFMGMLLLIISVPMLIDGILSLSAAQI